MISMKSLLISYYRRENLFSKRCLHKIHEIIPYLNIKNKNDASIYGKY